MSNKRARCCDCDREVSARCDVMKNHKRVCKGPSKLPRLEASQNASVPTASCVASAPLASSRKIIPSSSISESQSENIDLVSRKSKFDGWDEAAQLKKPLRNFLDGLTEREKLRIHAQCGKFIFACNLPFKIVKNPEFIEFVKILRPAYDPPSEHDIGNKILDKTYDEVTDSLTVAISNKEVVIMQDGWSTNQTKPVIAHSIHCGSQVYFVNAISTGTASKTAEYCTKLLIETIDKCEKQHHCKIIGVVTDNCSVMLNLRKLIVTAKPKIIAYGCTSHYLNNVGRKLTPQNKIIDIVTIQKCFKNHHFQASALNDMKGNRPILPSNTRWNSQQKCLANFITNHTNYLTILRKNPPNFPNEVANLIKRNDLYDDAQSILETATPIAIALDKVSINGSDAIKWCWRKKIINCSFFSHRVTPLLYLRRWLNGFIYGITYEFSVKIR